MLEVVSLKRENGHLTEVYNGENGHVTEVVSSMEGE